MTKPRRSALEYAIKLLGYRARAKRELQGKMLEKKYSPEEIEAVFVKLEKANLLNDEQFAHNYTRDKLMISRRGPRRIYFELIKHGVAKEIADQATKTIAPVDELAMAESLLAARARQWTKLEPLARYRRALGLLSRRGFSPRVVRAVLEDWPKY